LLFCRRLDGLTISISMSLFNPRSSVRFSLQQLFLINSLTDSFLFPRCPLREDPEHTLNSRDGKCSKCGVFCSSSRGHSVYLRGGGGGGSPLTRSNRRLKSQQSREEASFFGSTHLHIALSCSRSEGRVLIVYWTNKRWRTCLLKEAVETKMEPKGAQKHEYERCFLSRFMYIC